MARASAIGLEELEELEPLEKLEPRERLENPNTQTALKKRHVGCHKTTRRFTKNNTSFFQKNALVFSRTSASFFRPYKMGAHIGSDGKRKKQTHNAQSVNDLFATINSCH